MRKYTLILSALLLFCTCISYAQNETSTRYAASGVPATPQISHDQWDTDGNYTITINIWYGNNATHYKLYEKVGANGTYAVVKESVLTDNSPNAQAISISFTGKDSRPGTYYYYAELSNSYGSVTTSEVNFKVGISASEPLLIDETDADGIAVNQIIMDAGTHTYTLSCISAPSPVYTVVSVNSVVAEASVNGSKLTVKGLVSGRSSLAIKETSTGKVRYVGLRVKDQAGKLPGLPDYVAIGSVSEDTEADLSFWHATSSNDTNKRCDVRYIYINGGPTAGWRSWTTEDGGRVISYLKESLKLGMIPYFVYYNIPDGSESYSVDYEHINNTTYMGSYYNDLLFFLQLCNTYSNGEMVGIVLEPDFIGYMMQGAGRSPGAITAAGVASAYTSGVLKQGVDPNFPNTLTGLVQSINYIINKTCPNSHFGWQFNTWGYNGAPGKGLMHATETMGYATGKQFLKTAAQETASFYVAAGVTSYNADFISVDKYGLDGAYESNAATNPSGSMWFWNADLWNNYLTYVNQLHISTNLPVTLWQIPVGHVNSSQEANPYAGGLFTNLTNAVQKYEDSAPTFFFGDTFSPGTQTRFDYFATNATGDAKLTTSGGSGTITYGSHMQETRDAGVNCVLFGAGVGASTDAVGNPPTDDYWWITKLQRYYKNPVPLNKLETALTETRSVAKALKVFPYPCEDKLHIHSDKEICTVAIIDMLGVTRPIMHVKENNTHTLDVSNLLGGMYVLSLNYADGSVETAKIIKR